jgi:hypothetical protein
LLDLQNQFLLRQPLAGSAIRAGGQIPERLKQCDIVMNDQ